MKLLIEANKRKFFLETDFNRGDNNDMRKIFDRIYADAIKYIFEGSKPAEGEVK